MPIETQSIPCPDVGDAEKRVVIVGGGYAGMTLAVRLGRALRERKDLRADVLLLELDPCQQSLSELDLVAVGPERPEFCELWIPAVLKDLPVRTCFNRVNGIDFERRVLSVDGEHEVPYWRAAICTGAVASLPPIPGLKEHAITMWSVQDAQRLQHQIAEQFRLAARLPDPAQRRRALSFTVCGGGATGVEIVGTIGQLLPKRAAEAGLDRGDLQISLVEGRPEILYDLPERQRRKALDRLARLGVRVVTGSMVARIEDEETVLEDGVRVPSSVLVWCGGAAPDPDVVKWGFATDNRGRVPVNADLKSPDQPDVYVLGDVAAFRDPDTNRTLPMLAQFAIREAEHTAGSIIRELEGKAPLAYKPHMHGEFVSVGPSWGVGWAWRFRLSGIPAIIMKRMTYILYWWQVGGVKLAWSRTRELLSMGR